MCFMKKFSYRLLADYLLAVTLTLILISCILGMSLAALEIIALLFCIVLVIINIVNINRTEKPSKTFEKHLAESLYKNMLESTKAPIAIIDENRVIKWSNKCFKSEFGKNSPEIDEVIKNEDDISDNFSSVKILDVSYNVISAKLKGYTVLYFVEDKRFNKVSLKYNQSKPVVAMLMFDNREEFEIDAIDNEDAQIIAKVESTIQQWAAGTTGFYKKLSNSRYLVVFEEKNLKAFIKEKFKILEDIRQIKSDDKRFATISIGIGRNAETLKECELWARNALDMALGRGGDQVVIKEGKNYSFFGGISKETEKRSKVRARIIAMTLSDQIDNSDKVLIMGHRFSDLDSVGASVGMYSAVTKAKKKEAHIVIDKNETLALPLVKNIESISGEDIFISRKSALDLITENTLLIIVDTHSIDFLECKELYEKSHKVVVIDHHRMMVNYISNAIVFYHEPYASSASEMVTELVQYIGNVHLNRIEAEALLSGIMLDSKNFVLKTGVRTFEAAAYLKRKGADTVEVKRMFSNSINTYKVKYQLISDAEIFNSCAIACAEENSEDIRIASAQAADELLGIQGVKASFVIYSTEGCVNISARSFGDVNVQLIMEKMGGGGHQTMAGAQIKGKSTKEVIKNLIEIISPMEI